MTSYITLDIGLILFSITYVTHLGLHFHLSKFKSIRFITIEIFEYPFFRIPITPHYSFGL